MINCVERGPGLNEVRHSNCLTLAKQTLEHNENEIDRKQIINWTCLNDLFRCSFEVDPDSFMKHMFTSCLGFQPCIKESLQYQTSNKETTFFPSVSSDDIANYTSDVVAAARSNDLSTLKKLHKSGKTLSCCNPFGESMLHMVCRRGYSEMLSFLLEEVEVSVRIIDDSGRNPLHDALWNSNCNFDVVSMLIYRDPSLLLFSDKRGHSPFTYARKEHWRKWIEFLWDRKDRIIASVQKETMEIFRVPDEGNEIVN